MGAQAAAEAANQTHTADRYGVTPEQIATWKKEHGKVFRIDVEELDAYAFFRRPEEIDVEQAMANAETDVMAYGPTLAINLFLGGDDRFESEREEDFEFPRAAGLKLAAITQPKSEYRVVTALLKGSEKYDLTPELFKQWQEKHGTIYAVIVDSLGGFAYFRKPDLKVIREANKNSTTSVLGYAKTLSQLTWLGGDKRFASKDPSDYLFPRAAGNSLAVICQAKSAEIKEV